MLSLRRGCLLVSCSHDHGHSLLPFQLHSYRAILVVRLGVPLDLERSTAWGHHWIHVARVHAHSLFLHIAPFMQQGIGILHTVSSIYVFQLTSARTSLSRFPAAVSLLLTLSNDDSEILTVIPLALFGSEAERFTSSLLLSFAGGDTDSLVDRVIMMPLELLCSMASQPPRVGAVA